MTPGTAIKAQNFVADHDAQAIQEIVTVVGLVSSNSTVEYGMKTG
jgi:hypothetical protein